MNNSGAWKMCMPAVITFLLLLPFQAAADVLSVLYFDNNTEIQELDWLKKGLADMLITDLAATGKIQAVQREKLEQILKEQKLGQSGLVDEKTAAQIGKLTGANLVLTGNFLRLEEVLRINTTLYDVESGKSIGAASVEGLSGNILILEKQLALKLFDVLKLGLGEDEKIRVLQMPTQDIEALKYNYKGLDAMDQNKREEAQDYFKKALKQDKYYRGADLNLSRATFAVSGKSMFASALQETKIREESMKAIDELLDMAATSGFDCIVKKEELKIEASRKEDHKSIIHIPFTLTSRPDYVKQFVQTLQPYSGRGTGAKSSLTITREAVSIDPIEIVLFNDVYQFWRVGWGQLRGRFIFKNKNNDVLFATGWFTLTVYPGSYGKGIILSDGDGPEASMLDLTVSTDEIETSIIENISEIQFEVRRGDKE